MMTDSVQSQTNSAESLINDPVWLNALTLAERIALLKNNPATKLPANKLNSVIGQRKFNRWKSQYPFNLSDYLSNRLALENATEEDLLYVLSEPIEAIQPRLAHTPDWLAEIEEIFANFELSGSTEGDNLRNAVGPFSRWGLDNLRRGIAALESNYTKVPFNATWISNVLIAYLGVPINMCMFRAFALELNIARMQNQLHGESASARYADFFVQLKQKDKLLNLMRRYPVLARQLVTIIDNYVNYAIEFLDHLCADWEFLCNTFGLDAETDFLTKVFSSGDTHRRGRAVFVLEFSSGSRLVYKPKPLNVDANYQRLLSWVNQHSDIPPLKTIKILNQGSYGWVEFVEMQPCNDAAEVKRFYTRLGGYLALLWVFGVTDIHSENLIAAGEQPIIIDLEAFLTPRTTDLNNVQKASPGSAALLDSVLQVGLLPQRQYVNQESDGLDISGMGSMEGQVSPWAVPVYEGIGTDEMRVVRERQTMGVEQNQPTLGGERVVLLDYAQDIVSGFSKVYQTILKHRDELIKEVLPIFDNDEVRLLFRATSTYASLLRESYHPDFLHDATERDLFFDHLWTVTVQRPAIAKIIEFESADLQAGEIPIFTATPSSANVTSSLGTTIPDSIAKSGLELAQSRIEKMRDFDLERQIWFIETALATSNDVAENAVWKHSELLPSTKPATQERLLREARRVGDRLCDLALQNDTGVSWLGLELINQRTWFHSPISPDLYGGTAGITVFLAYLGALTNESRYTDLARLACISSVQQQANLLAYGSTIIGGFSGLGSTIYMLSQLGALWQEPELIAQAVAISELLPQLIERDSELDILGGSAGCILSLLNLYQLSPSPDLLKVATTCGDYLISQSVPQADGVGWIRPQFSEYPLTGFSHGNAGIGYALLRLAEITNSERFRNIGLAAIKYERNVFSAEYKNWPDLRDAKHEYSYDELKTHFMDAWCHGAPGITLGRLALLPYYDDAEIRSEIAVGLQTTLQHGFGLNHSLCHGDLGNLEVLLKAQQVLGDNEYSTNLEPIAAMVLDSIERQGWLSGFAQGLELPGLMLGIAGIGYELLRLAQPEAVPSILLLESPAPKAF